VHLKIVRTLSAPLNTPSRGKVFDPPNCKGDPKLTVDLGYRARTASEHATKTNRLAKVSARDDRQTLMTRT